MAIKHGTAKSEGIYGTGSSDTLYGYGGDDRLYAADGSDTLFAGSGNDGLYGEGGNDFLHGEAGIDKLVGGVGDDILWGGSENDWLSGGNDTDVLFGGTGNDTLRGDAGDDQLDGEAGINNLGGGAGNDLLIYSASGLVGPAGNVFNGDVGNDTLQINAAGVTVNTPNGNSLATIRVAMNDFEGKTIGFQDGPSTTFITTGKHSGIENFAINQGASLVFSGGAENVSATGGMYADVFGSGAGAEVFSGGGGADQFYFDNLNGETDHILGFNAAEDLIISGNWANSNGDPTMDRTITEANGNTYITTSNDGGPPLHTIALVGVVGVTTDIFRDGLNWYPEIG